MSTKAAEQGEQQRNVTIRFPHVDAAGIIFYPRYVELLCHAFPGLSFASPPFTYRARFMKPNRLGDRLTLSLTAGDEDGSWQAAGLCDGSSCFGVDFAPGSGELAANAHRPGVAAFTTAAGIPGAWASGTSGHLQFSRYFEYLVIAIEAWFERTLGCPFAAFHVERRIGIPTVSLESRVRELPATDERFSIWLRPGKLGTSSLGFTSWLVSGGQCHVETRQTVVFVAMRESGYAKVAMPDDVRAAFQRQMDDASDVAP